MQKHVVDIDEIGRALDEFSTPGCSPLSAQRLAVDMGRALGQAIRHHGIEPDYLCPVLRAGLPLAVGLSNHYPQAQVAPIHASRLGVSNAIAIERVAPIRSGSTLLLVDTIAATGSTLVALGRMLKAEWEHLRLLVAIGYASPEALQRLADSGHFEAAWLGRVADGVDAQGYLFPATHGDAGDKMFAGMF